MALTADTKVQRMPSESAAQSLAVALPASQSRYCCVTSLILVLSMGISRQITAVGIRATWSNSNILKENAFSEDRHRFPVCFFFFFFLYCHERQWMEVGMREILFR